MTRRFLPSVREQCERDIRCFERALPEGLVEEDARDPEEDDPEYLLDRL
jgi:hypothetical protein